ncbi:MAG TPA: TonB-dependent receptor [Caulobacteraceae bacterium]|jgi:outer membrane receptor protein involved in Fe transport
MMGFLGRRGLRRATWSATLLASTMLTGIGSALAAAADAPAAPAANAATSQLGEIVVTAQKRSENIQKVPMSIQALDTKKLTQLNVTEFNDYVKYMPSVTFQNLGPNAAQVYMRGVSSGDTGNHSGPLPTVGTYLDEMPITTIGGTLDVHVYDIARVEVLPGPQGTLYGASSEAGTMRIITNKPSTAGFSAAYDAQVNQVDHGGTGYTFEGYVNVPVNDKTAIRLVAFDQHDAGYIDNVFGTRPFASAGTTINNARFVKKDFNTVDSYGGRAALKFDLNEDWTFEPTLMGQDVRSNGVFGYEPSVGFLQVQHFQPDTDHDKWGAASLAINGKLGRFNVVYAGSYFLRQQDTQSDYTDYSVFYDQAYGSGASWTDNNGNILANPSQEIYGTDKFTKESHELRISSPSSDRLRVIAGVFEQRQTHWIIQDYKINGFGTDISVTGWPGTIWLTDQMRIDRDAAVFGDATFDITPDLSVNAGIRGYDYRNSLEGFFGYGIGYSSHTGEARCFQAIHYRGDPCVNLDKTVTGSGETHKLNITYKINGDDLIYATYSTGFRPGGVNRNANFGAYRADGLDNYEIGWKTSLFDHAVRFNGAAYFELWRGFQYSFLGPNSLTIIENGPNAGVTGLESSIDWRATQHLTLSFNGAYNKARMLGVLCSVFGENPCAPADVSAPSGRHLPYTPAFKGNLTARYTFELADWDAHVQGALLYNSLNGLGLRDQDIINYGKISSYATADFSFGAERGSMSTELFIKNAFDNHSSQNNYLPCGSACAGSYPGVPSALYKVAIQPLTVGLRFGQKF